MLVRPSRLHETSPLSDPAAAPVSAVRAGVVWPLLIVVALLVHIVAVNYVADDGFISFRYAEHLAQGQGVVYNIGERVEGYTNFLWVLFLGVMKWALPAIPMQQVARVAGSAVSIATLFVAFRFSAVATGGPVVGLLAAALLAANSSLVAWAPAGLETCLFMLLVFCAAVCQVTDFRTAAYRPWAPFLLGLASLTRPDGVIVAAATVAAIVVYETPRPITAAGLARPLRLAFRFGLLFLVIYLPHMLWRYSYYGDVVPNTAYAKVGFGVSQLARGARYLWSYAVQYGVYVWALPVVLHAWRERAVWYWYFLWLIALYLAYVLYVGGDGLAFHRFIVHVSPLIAMVAAAGLVDSYRRFVRPSVPVPVARGLAAVAVTLVLVLTASTTWVPLLLVQRARWFEAQSGLWFPGDGQDHSYVWFDNYFVERLAAAARYIEQQGPPDALVAATPAGAIGYYMRNPVLDMLGLNDKHIARTPSTPEDTLRYGRAGHEKGDGAYVLSRNPEYILMGNVAVLPYPLDEQSMPGKLVLKSEHELWENPEFHRRYELVTVRLADQGLFQYFSFYRRKPGA